MFIQCREVEDTLILELKGEYCPKQLNQLLVFLENHHKTNPDQEVGVLLKDLALLRQMNGVGAE